MSPATVTDNASTPLVIAERTRLGECEVVVERGLATFVEVGQALLEIRDSRLYREDFKTFEDYCRERWDFTDRRARQLMAAAEIGTTVPVANEAQARELVPLKEDEAELISAWREANFDGASGDATAKMLRGVVRVRVARRERKAEEMRELEREAREVEERRRNPPPQQEGDRWAPGTIVADRQPEPEIEAEHERTVEATQREVEARRVEVEAAKKREREAWERRTEAKDERGKHWRSTWVGDPGAPTLPPGMSAWERRGNWTERFRGELDDDGEMIVRYVGGELNGHGGGICGDIFLAVDVGWFPDEVAER